MGIPKDRLDSDLFGLSSHNVNRHDALGGHTDVHHPSPGAEQGKYPGHCRPTATRFKYDIYTPVPCDLFHNLKQFLLFYIDRPDRSKTASDVQLRVLDVSNDYPAATGSQCSHGSNHADRSRSYDHSDVSGFHVRFGGSVNANRQRFYHGALGKG